VERALDGETMKDFDWLILSTLYSCKNISRTAESLFTSQPNLTKRLHLIEKELRVQIVTRSTRGITFTPLGEQLALKAGEISRLIDETKKQTGKMNKGYNTIKLAAPNSFTRNELPDILNKFQQENEGVIFDLRTCLSNEIVILMKRGEIEVGFVHGNMDLGRNSIFLFKEILYVFSKDKISMEELPERPHIEYVRSPLTSIIINDWWESRFLKPLNTFLKVAHGDICRKLVSQGLGFAFFFGNNFTESDTHLNRIIAMRDNTPVSKETWMIYNKFSRRRSIVNKFIDFIRKWKNIHKNVELVNPYQDVPHSVGN
jgi:DNA-binding transcriptional LysR family regulator